MPLTDPELQSPLAWDLMWADPARETDINEENEEYLFLENNRRKTSCLFTAKALNAFIKTTGYQYVIRAHECQVNQDHLRFRRSVKCLFSKWVSRFSMAVC